MPFARSQPRPPTVMALDDFEEGVNRIDFEVQARQLGLIPNQQAIEAFVKAGVKTIRLWPKWLKDDANLVRRVRKAGAKLHLNGTTGKPGDILPLLPHKPDSLSSDDPARLVQTLADL